MDYLCPHKKYKTTITFTFTVFIMMSEYNFVQRRKPARELLLKYADTKPKEKKGQCFQSDVTKNSRLNREM